MAGVKGRSGRKALSAREHLLRGTWRPDRHGPRPALHPGPGLFPPAAVQAGAAKGVRGVTGAELVRALKAEWVLDDAAAKLHLEALQVAWDQRQAVDAKLDGPEGLLARVAGGLVDPAAIKVLLAARHQYQAAIDAALRGLQLDDGPVGKAALA